MQQRSVLVVRTILGFFAVIFFAVALTLSIFLIGNKTDGFYSFFSTRGYLAADDLMGGTEHFDAFRKGEMVLFSADGDFERSIVKGQIVLFKKSIDGNTSIAARRVDSVVIKRLPSGGTVTTYLLKADNSEELLPFDVAPNEILGVYSRVSKSAGAFFAFLDSFTGFVVLIVAPSVLGLSAAGFLIFSYLRKRD